MGGLCVARGCKNRKENTYITKLTFHKFPINEELKEKWVKALRKENWEPTKNSRICSEHFNKEDFDKSSPFRTYLKKNAVPSIFPAIPAYLDYDMIKIEPRTAEQTSDSELPEPQVSSNSKQPPTKRIKEVDPVKRQNELLKLACDLLYASSKPEESNECLDIAKVWGTKLMSLQPKQRKYAEKAINDILFEADLGTLHRHSVQINLNNNRDPLGSP